MVNTFKLPKETMFQDNSALQEAQMANKHLIDRFLEERTAGRAPTSMIIGHRGGFIDGPENSMRCFRAAINHNLDGIEFDVGTNFLISFTLA